jgi:hypothetical protein
MVIMLSIELGMYFFFSLAFDMGEEYGWIISLKRVFLCLMLVRYGPFHLYEFYNHTGTHMNCPIIFIQQVNDY